MHLEKAALNDLALTACTAANSEAEPGLFGAFVKDRHGDIGKYSLHVMYLFDAA